MKRLVSKVVAAGATIVGSSIAFASTVAAQRYTYDYTYDATEEAAGGVIASMGILFYCCILCIPLLVLFGFAYWVYKDATKYKVENPALWGLLTFCTGIVGLLIYFLAIRPEAVKKLEGGSKPDNAS